MSGSKNGKHTKIIRDIVFPIVVSLSSGILLWLLNMFSDELKLLINSTWIYIVLTLLLAFALLAVALYRQRLAGFAKYVLENRGLALKYIALVAVGILIGVFIVTSTDQPAERTTSRRERKEEKKKPSTSRPEPDKPTKPDTENKADKQVPNQSKPIYVGQTLSQGYDMGVNSSEEKTDWLTNKQGFMRMAYPSDQSWGAVFITVGPPTDPPRPSQDFSSYKSISLELRGETGRESVDIGIKDSEDPDDASETKVTVMGLTNKWKRFTFPLSEFTSADLSKLYVVLEFVFNGPEAQTVYFRNIKYSGNRVGASKAAGTSSGIKEANSRISQLAIEIVKNTKVPAWGNCVASANDDTWGEIVQIFPMYWSILDEEDTIGEILCAFYGKNDVTNVSGWKAENISGSKKVSRLVSYTWQSDETREGEVAGYFWVVDESGEVVPINGNKTLEKKYRIKWDSRQAKFLANVY